MLLARVGLRAHEVASLCLEDIDWHESRLIMRPGKTHHERVLPLVHDVGTTLAAYLRWGRPTTTSRVVFLLCRAPYLPFRDAAAISRIASRALKRAGVGDRPRLGAHAFRHSAASHMVNQGVQSSSRPLPSASPSSSWQAFSPVPYTSPPPSLPPPLSPPRAGS